MLISIVSCSTDSWVFAIICFLIQIHSVLLIFNGWPCINRSLLLYRSHTAIVVFVQYLQHKRRTCCSFWWWCTFSRRPEYKNHFFFVFLFVSQLPINHFYLITFSLLFRVSRTSSTSFFHFHSIFSLKRTRERKSARTLSALLADVFGPIRLDLAPKRFKVINWPARQPPTFIFVVILCCSSIKSYIECPILIEFGLKGRCWSITRHRPFRLNRLVRFRTVLLVLTCVALCIRHPSCFKALLHHLCLLSRPLLPQHRFDRHRPCTVISQ